MGINPYFHHVLAQKLVHQLDHMEARHKNLTNQLFNFGDKLQQRLMRTDLGSLQDSYLKACDYYFRYVRDRLEPAGFLKSDRCPCNGVTNSYYRSEP